MRLGSDGFDLFIHHFCPAGAFVVGVIVPREGGISIAFVEKLEDMVQIIFLPIVSKHSSTPLPFSTCLVFYDIRTQHQLGIDQYRYVVSP